MDPRIFLIWNVRGLNSSSQQDVIHSFLEASRADIVSSGDQNGSCPLRSLTFHARQ
jgi:hypothetical protein